MKTLLKPTEIRDLMLTAEALKVEYEKASNIFKEHQIRLNALKEDDADRGIYKDENSDLATMVCDIDMAMYYLHRLGL